MDKVVKAVGVGLGVAGLILLARKVEAAPPENIIVSDLTIQPTEVYVGEPVEISVVVTNVGGKAGSHEVTLEVI